jgi:hypothetical protein
MKGVHVVILQFEDTVSGEPPMTPFLAVVEDTPNWEAQIAAAHGVIPSRMRVVKLCDDVLRSGAVTWPLEVFADLFAQSQECRHPDYEGALSAAVQDAVAPTNEREMTADEFGEYLKSLPRSSTEVP